MRAHSRHAFPVLLQLLRECMGAGTVHLFSPTLPESVGQDTQQAQPTLEHATEFMPPR